VKKKPELIPRLLEVVEGLTAGDPMKEVKWCRRSTRGVAEVMGVSHTKARHLLRHLGFSLRVNRKALVTQTSPDREEQFQRIEELRQGYLARGQPVVSVDAKKRELVGAFKNPGRTWRREAQPVNVYDFPSQAKGVAIPYGIYDVGRRDGFVVVGTSHNTPAFAGSAVGQWWRHAGQKSYPGASELLVLADSGSSNGFQAGGWKEALQRMADRTGLLVTVAHYPTGASKWNPVEHRLFSAISSAWAGEALVDYETIRHFIRNTRTPSGARCRIRIDRRSWPTQRSRKPDLSRLHIRPGTTLPHLNYTLLPAALRAR
jgi:hypothetical protein